MVFSSATFLFLFLPLVLIGNRMMRTIRQKNIFLMGASVVFYAWGGAQYALLVLFSTFVNYLVGLFLGRSKMPKKPALVIGVAFNLAILCFFKYFNFFVDNLNAIAGVLGLPPIHAPLIPLPVGISFFTFQIMSYIIDVYRGKVEYQKSYVNLTLYILLFPQLIAGPIVRYIDVEREIQQRDVSIAQFAKGVERFIVGLAKKVLIANGTGEIAAYVFDDFHNLSFAMSWIAVVCYAIQIYFDFSAYSDMAIGLGKMFGFHFLENFNYPYVSESVQEFWRRWHISLSSWFRDYLYIPLGGNRGGLRKTYRNLLIVFFVTGLWHGAGWNFIIWGLWHGLFLILERGETFASVLKKTPSFARRAYTLLVVLVGWVFFRANSMQEAWTFLRSMFSFDINGVSLYPILDCITPEKMFCIAAGMLFSAPIAPWLRQRALETRGNAIFVRVPAQMLYCAGLMTLFMISICYMAGTSFNPFIYFRF